jgi:hypothetical protein
MTVIFNKKTEKEKLQQPQINNTDQYKDRQFLDKNNDGIPDYLVNKSFPSMVQTNKDLNQYEIDTDPEFESYIYSLQGYELDPVNNLWVQTETPVMDEAGIRKIKSHLKPFINKHSQTTSLDVDEIKKMIEMHMETLIDYFQYDYRKHKVSKQDLSLIFDQLNWLTFIIISKSIGAGQRNAITARTKLTGTANPTGFPN